MIKRIKITYESILNGDIGEIKVSLWKIPREYWHGFNSSATGKVKITIIYLIKDMLKYFEHHDTLNYVAATSEADCLFKIRYETNPLYNHKTKVLHNLVAKGLYLSNIYIKDMG